MSKPKYDVKRIPQEVFDRWHEEMVATNYLQQTNPASGDRRLVEAARVPDTTAAELEGGLLFHIHEGCASTYPVSRAWLTSLVDMLEEILAARAQEAKENDDE